MKLLSQAVLAIIALSVLQGCVVYIERDPFPLSNSSPAERPEIEYEINCIVISKDGKITEEECDTSSAI